MSNAAYVSATTNTGTVTASFPAGGGVPGVTPSLTSLQISQAGPTVGPNAKVVVWDGPVGGAAVYTAFLSAPGQGGAGAGALAGSTGIIQDIPLPKSPQGLAGIQGSPGNQLNVQVTGTGANQVAVNCRFSDGLP